MIIFSVSNTKSPIQCSRKYAKKNRILWFILPLWFVLIYHPDLQLLDNYKFFFFRFATVNFKRFGVCNIHFQWYIANSQISNTSIGRPIKHICTHWVLDVPHCLMKHVGASSRGRAWKKWYVSWALIWSRHIECGHASQDSLHHIDVEKYALWALPSGKSCIWSPPKKIMKNYYHNVSLPWALAFPYQTTSLASLTAKPVGPCHCIY